MKWLCVLCNNVMCHLHKSVFKISLNQTEGNGVFRAWAHITLTDIYIVWILKPHAGFLLVGEKILSHSRKNLRVSFLLLKGVYPFYFLVGTKTRVQTCKGLTLPHPCNPAAMWEGDWRACTSFLFHLSSTSKQS